MSDSNCPRCGNRVGNGGCVCQAGMAQGQAMAAANQRAGAPAQMNQLAGQAGRLGQAAQLQGTALLGQMLGGLQGGSPPGKPTPKRRVRRPKDRLNFVRDLQGFLMDRKSDFASDPALQSVLFFFLLEDD